MQLEGNRSESVRDAKVEMYNWDLIVEHKQLSVNEVLQLHDSRVKNFKAEREVSLMFKDKSRVKWDVEGDENNHFFHGLIRGRNQCNNIKGLISNSFWVDKPAKIKEAIVQYFSHQFRESSLVRLTFSSDCFKKLFTSQVAALESPFIESENKEAVWSCEESKIPGLDGISFASIKAQRKTIKVDVMNFIQEFAASGKIVRGGNSTFLSLIPKKIDPLSLDDFRAISLVGCQYKIRGKLLAERLKTTMADLISDNQTTFVGGHQILDGVLMANEVVN